MAYKFLLHDPQVAQLNEWAEIGQLNDVHIASIDDDVVAGSNSKVGTSIPTPFGWKKSFR